MAPNFIALKNNRTKKRKRENESHAKQEKSQALAIKKASTSTAIESRENEIDNFKIDDIIWAKQSNYPIRSELIAKGKHRAKSIEAVDQYDAFIPPNSKVHSFLYYFQLTLSATIWIRIFFLRKFNRVIKIKNSSQERNENQLKIYDEMIERMN